MSSSGVGWDGVQTQNAHMGYTIIPFVYVSNIHAQEELFGPTEHITLNKSYKLLLIS